MKIVPIALPIVLRRLLDIFDGSSFKYGCGFGIFPGSWKYERTIFIDHFLVLDLNLSITNGIVSSKIYDKRDDFTFKIVNFPFLDGDVPRSLHMVYIFLSLFVLLECVLV